MTTKTETKTRDLPVGEVVREFIELVKYAHSDRRVEVVERKDRFTISVDDLAVASILKRADSISLHLSKFKPYATTFNAALKKNLVSYGAAGHFFIVDSKGIEKAVKAFGKHYDDLIRIRAAKSKIV